MTSSGDLIAFDPETSDIVIRSRSGQVKQRWDAGTTEAHGLTVVEHEGAEAVWIVDPGFVVPRSPNGEYKPARGNGAQAVLFRLDGTRLRSLERPAIPAYESGHYCPTSVAVDEVRFGGSGDIWLADGYGSNLVHRFDADGNHLQTLDGSTGAGRFDCPHAVFLDRRAVQPRLYVADRGNARLQVFAMDGSFLRVVEGSLNSPSALASSGDLLYVAELNARLAVLDNDDVLLGYVSEGCAVTERPGWPNAQDEAGNPVRPPLTPGLFNSPHGLSVDPAGTVFVAEWLIGGRMPRLNPRR